MEGIGFPDGRIVDGAVKYCYDLSNSLSIGFGYRAVEGFVNLEDSFSSIWLNVVLASAQFQFWRPESPKNLSDPQLVRHWQVE